MNKIERFPSVVVLITQPLETSDNRFSHIIAISATQPRIRRVVACKQNRSSFVSLPGFIRLSQLLQRSLSISRNVYATEYSFTFFYTLRGKYVSFEVVDDSAGHITFDGINVRDFRVVWRSRKVRTY